MKVFVTGAPGYLGAWIVRELLAAGHTVRVLVRRTSKLGNLEGLTYERADGDVLDPPSLGQAIGGCEAVVHSAGVAQLDPKDVRHLYAVNVDGVDNVLGAALAAGVRRAVLTSSTAALGGSLVPRIADETTPSNAPELGLDYFHSKLRGEQVALGYGAKGLEVVVARPGYVLGPGDIYGSSAFIIRALARRRLPIYVDGLPSFCDVRDVARGHVAALERGGPGEVYHLAGHNLRVRDLVERTAALAGVSPPREVPYQLAYAVAAAADVVARISGRRLDLSRNLLRASRLCTHVSSAKASRELGYSIRPFDVMIADTLKDFLGRGLLPGATPELRRLKS